MYYKIVLILLVITLFIVSPIVVIGILNYLLSQMFTTIYTPLEITFWNWLSIVGIELLMVGGSKNK